MTLNTADNVIFQVGSADTSDVKCEGECMLNSSYAASSAARRNRNVDIVDHREWVWGFLVDPLSKCYVCILVYEEWVLELSD